MVRLVGSLLLVLELVSLPVPLRVQVPPGSATGFSKAPATGRRSRHLQQSGAPPLGLLATPGSLAANTSSPATTTGLDVPSAGVAPLLLPQQQAVGSVFYPPCALSLPCDLTWVRCLSSSPIAWQIALLVNCILNTYALLRKTSFRLFQPLLMSQPRHWRIRIAWPSTAPPLQGNSLLLSSG